VAFMVENRDVPHLQGVTPPSTMDSQVFGPSHEKKEAQHRSPTNDAVLGFVGVEMVENSLQHPCRDRCQGGGRWRRSLHAGQHEPVTGRELGVTAGVDTMIPFNMAELGPNGVG
jgi:hypothetical protein